VSSLRDRSGPLREVTPERIAARAAAKPMAHPDPRASESARHMAHRAGLRRFLPPATRRREVVLVLGLVIAACAISASMPGVWASNGFTASPSASASEPTDMAALDPTASPTATYTPTASPTESPSPTATDSPSPSPADGPTAKPTPKPTPHPVYRYVALGDSLTSGYNTPGPAWPAILDTKDPYIRMIHNAGVPGDLTADMLSRFNRDVVAYHPNFIFVLGGTNDLGHNVAISTIVANLKKIILAAKANKIGVVLLLVPPDAYQGEVDTIDALNLSITHLGNVYKLAVADIHTPLSASTGVIQSRYTSDGLHFSALGADVVANTVWARVKRFGY
jgi:acyl-CoA thioesterase-1